MTTSNNKTINTGELEVAYTDEGKGAIPIIFIHGFPFNKGMWEPQVEFLKQTQRVITYDIRGYGQSSAGMQIQSISVFANDLVNFMDALIIPKAIVCGLSMGGYILLNAVSRFHHRFEAIILSDTQCIADTPETKEKRYATISQIAEHGLSDFTEGFIKNVFHPVSLEMKPELVEKIKAGILSTPAEIITGTLNALAQRNETCSALTSVSVPTLILCGKQDKITPPVQSEFLHRTIANSSCYLIDEASHVSNLDQPAIFNQHLIDFISGLEKQES